MLLLRRNSAVPVDDLVDALWGDDPPESAPTALQGQISALRKVLGAKRIETRAPGYVLKIEGAEVDTERFERQIADAKAMREPTKRLELIRDALRSWRGGPLTE